MDRICIGKTVESALAPTCQQRGKLSHNSVSLCPDIYLFWENVPNEPVINHDVVERKVKWYTFRRRQMFHSRRPRERTRHWVSYIYEAVGIHRKNRIYRDVKYPHGVSYLWKIDSLFKLTTKKHENPVLLAFSEVSDGFPRKEPVIQRALPCYDFIVYFVFYVVK